MTVKRFVQAVAVTAVALFLMAATASADEILFATNGLGTGFTTGGLTLNSSGGTGAATLTFTPNGGTTVGTPTFIDLGDFMLTCSDCGTTGSGTGDATFSLFTFDLVVTDTTDGATGEFIGTSIGGAVYSDSSDVSIDWSPVQLGPGTNNALNGTNFGPTSFTISNPTLIVAPNSGTPAGDTTVQGTLASQNDSTVPEPATMALVGGAIIGLASLARKRRRP